jgi:hypothetical protein
VKDDAECDTDADPNADTEGNITAPSVTRISISIAATSFHKDQKCKLLSYGLKILF